jgi:cellulose synthase/poly-beta-1,6-N-acetylglucosamine synthase-like glycosyltransferase
MKLLFWIGFAWLAYVYVGYPVLMWMLGKIRPFRPAVDSNFLPSVSVLIAARNEEKDIAWKVQETLAWDYPPDRLQVLVASDASTDGTDAILAGFRDPRFRFVRMEHRSGKQLGLNRLAEQATGEILFFTDANAHVNKSILRRMVSYFADPRVGCVTGPEENADRPVVSAMESGGSRYLGYENWINQAESAMGSVLVCNGAMFSMRRSSFTPLQPDIANDLESPLCVGGLGYAVLFDPSLVSIEVASNSARQEFARRRRICAQGLLGMWRMRRFLKGMRGWQFVSRKLLRWLGLLPMAAIAVASAVLSGTYVFALIFSLSAVFLFLALIGLAANSSGRACPKVCAYPLFFLLIHCAALMGLADTCRGRRFGVWEIAPMARREDEPPLQAAVKD